MDIYCPRCGEPWDMDELHEEATSRYGIPYGDPQYDSAAYQAFYERVRRDFQRLGCEALGGTCSPEPDESRDSTWGLTRAQAASALYEVLGDDLDGAAAMLDDLDW